MVEWSALFCINHDRFYKFSGDFPCDPKTYREEKQKFGLKYVIGWVPDSYEVKL